MYSHPERRRLRFGVGEMTNGVVVLFERLREEPELTTVGWLAPRPEVTEVEEARRQRLDGCVQPLRERNITEELARLGEKREPCRLGYVWEHGMSTDSCE